MPRLGATILRRPAGALPLPSDIDSRIGIVLIDFWIAVVSVTEPA
jgi:hypothetical protein